MVVKEKIIEQEKIQTLSNVTTFTNITDGVKNADLVVEAATENVDLKLKIFKCHVFTVVQLDHFVSSDSVWTRFA